MSLEGFVKRVGCISPRATVLDASLEMRSRGIGTVVVISDDYKPIGVLTDRDIVMRAVADNKAADKTAVETVMSGNVVTLPEAASIRTVTETMRDKGIRRVVILDENERVTGIVSFDDLMLLLGMEVGNLAASIVAGLSRPPEEATTMQER